MVIGAVLSKSQGTWPSSTEFLESVFPSVKKMLVSQDLFNPLSILSSGIIRHNANIIFRRAKVLAWLLRKRWCIDMLLSDLPKQPVWHINTTCIETGKNWRFTRDSMGDWRFGRHFSPDIALADALAASAAVPYAIGALTLHLPQEGWWAIDPKTKDRTQPIEPIHKRVRLWDGGAYENLAVEPLYKPAEGLQACDFLICSDASAPLSAPSGIVKSILKGRLASPRLFDIASDQIRSLRSRMLMKAITQHEIEGCLLRLGNRGQKFSAVATRPSELDDDQCRFCLHYPTNLIKIQEDAFDLIALHGREIARLVISSSVNVRKQPSA